MRRNEMRASSKPFAARGKVLKVFTSTLTNPSTAYASSICSRFSGLSAWMEACVIWTRNVATPGAKKMKASMQDNMASERQMIDSSLARRARTRRARASSEAVT